MIPCLNENMPKKVPTGVFFIFQRAGLVKWYVGNTRSWRVALSVLAHPTALRGSSQPLSAYFSPSLMERLIKLNGCTCVIYLRLLCVSCSRVSVCRRVLQLVPFFFTTWEHYYTDELILPVINGPSEGVSGPPNQQRVGDGAIDKTPTHPKHRQA